MRMTRHRRPLDSLLALALLLGVTSLPAAAQPGSEAVVCVGSERRAVATNPIRRVFAEDKELLAGARRRWREGLHGRPSSLPRAPDHALPVVSHAIGRPTLFEDPSVGRVPRPIPPPRVPAPDSNLLIRVPVGSTSPNSDMYASPVLGLFPAHALDALTHQLPVGW